MRTAGPKTNRSTSQQRALLRISAKFVRSRGTKGSRQPIYACARAGPHAAQRAVAVYTCVPRKHSRWVLPQRPELDGDYFVVLCGVLRCHQYQ